MTTFGDLHARWYDRWFHAKDYDAEAEQLKSIFTKEDGKVHTVLDIGCGTGRHLELLARGGYEVVGVDRSAAMVEVTIERLAGSGVDARVLLADAAGLALDRVFDAVIMMSWVLSYQVTDEEMLTALRVAHRHLRPGGLLVFDVLDGITLLRGGAGPRSTFNLVEDGGTRFLRSSRSTTDHTEQLHDIDLRMWAFSGGHTVAAREPHLIRYLLPRELELVLELAGFQPLGSGPLAGNIPWAGRPLSRLFWARKP